MFPRICLQKSGEQIGTAFWSIKGEKIDKYEIDQIYLFKKVRIIFF